MDKRTTSIIITVAAVLLCGCPGLASVLFGGIFAVVSFIPGAKIDMFGSRDPQSALAFGIGSLCVGVIFLLIAAAAIFFAWRRRSKPASSVSS